MALLYSWATVNENRLFFLVSECQIFPMVPFLLIGIIASKLRFLNFFCMSDFYLFCKLFLLHCPAITLTTGRKMFEKKVVYLYKIFSENRMALSAYKRFLKKVNWNFGLPGRTFFHAVLLHIPGTGMSHWLFKWHTQSTFLISVYS